MVNTLLNGNSVSEESISLLKEELDSLLEIPQKEDLYILALDKDKDISLDLSYEINELKKDIFYLTHSKEAFLSFLEKLHANFSSQVHQGKELLKDTAFNAFITDRDGTVNNYCGRYASSTQSIYNALFLTSFAKKRSANSVILTSAPLDNIGLVDISVTPDNVFIYAGSKGREYFNKEKQRCQFPSGHRML